jgi:hypothetical protein
MDDSQDARVDVTLEEAGADTVPVLRRPFLFKVGGVSTDTWHAHERGGFPWRGRVQRFTAPGGGAHP